MAIAHKGSFFRECVFVACILIKKEQSQTGYRPSTKSRDYLESKTPKKNTHHSDMARVGSLLIANELV